MDHTIAVLESTDTIWLAFLWAAVNDTDNALSECSRPDEICACQAAALLAASAYVAEARAALKRTDTR